MLEHKLSDLVEPPALPDFWRGWIYGPVTNASHFVLWHRILIKSRPTSIRIYVTQLLYIIVYFFTIDFIFTVTHFRCLSTSHTSTNNYRKQVLLVLSFLDQNSIPHLDRTMWPPRTTPRHRCSPRTRTGRMLRQLNYNLF